MNVLAFPFSFNPQIPGQLNYTEQGGPTYKAQEIQAFFLTNKKERPIYADYGIDDPAFADFDETAFGADFGSFYGSEDIDIDSLQIEEQEGALAKITVGYR